MASGISTEGDPLTHGHLSWQGELLREVVGTELKLVKSPEDLVWAPKSKAFVTFLPHEAVCSVVKRSGFGV